MAIFAFQLYLFRNFTKTGLLRRNEESLTGWALARTTLGFVAAEAPAGSNKATPKESARMDDFFMVVLLICRGRVTIFLLSYMKNKGKKARVVIVTYPPEG